MGIKKLFGNITNFKDKDATGEGSALATWAKTNTGDGKPDVIITACGTMPSSLYPFPNKKPDGSIVEEFVYAGNILINVADWIGYMSYEGGVRSPNNGPSGAASHFAHNLCSHSIIFLIYNTMQDTYSNRIPM